MSTNPTQGYTKKPLPFLIFLCITTPVVVITTIWFLFRRETQPIKARYPWLVGLQSGIIIAYNVYICISQIVEEVFPCQSVAAVSALAFTSSGQVTMMRQLRLLVVHAHTAFLESQHDATAKTRRNSLTSTATITNPNGQASNIPLWFSKFRDITLPRMFAVSVAIILVVFIPQLTPGSSLPREVVETSPECTAGAGYYIFVVYVLSVLLLFMVFIVLVRHSKDSFLLVAELKFLSITECFLFFSWALILLIPNWKHYNNNTFPISKFFSLTGMLAFWAGSVAMPLYQSLFVFSEDKVETSDDKSGSKQLSDWLKNPIGFEAFREFLKREFSIENIYFWEEVNNYHDYARQLIQESKRRYSEVRPSLVRMLTTKLTSLVTSNSDADSRVSALSVEDLRGDIESKLLVRAQEIYETYIHPGAATYEINISAEIINAIQDQLAQYENKPAAAEPDVVVDQIDSVKLNAQPSSTVESPKMSVGSAPASADALPAIELQAIQIGETFAEVQVVDMMEANKISSGDLDDSILSSSDPSVRRATESFSVDAGRRSSFSVSSSRGSTNESKAPGGRAAAPPPRGKFASDEIATASEPIRLLATLFDKAQDAILDLMSRDSFPRFKRSSLFNRAKTQVVRQSVIAGDANIDQISEKSKTDNTSKA